MYSEITIPKGVSATIQDGGTYWIVRLTAPTRQNPTEIDRETQTETEQTQEPVILCTESNRADSDYKREQAKLRKRRQRERERAAGYSATERDSVTSERDSVTFERDSVTSERDSVTCHTCLIDCLNDSINNININNIQETRQTIKQASVAKIVSQRDSVTSERDSVTPDDEQFYLDLDYPLPTSIETEKTREAWKAWIQYRRYTGGCNRISIKTIREIFEMLEFYHRTGGELAVIQVLEYSVEKGRLNKLIAPRDVYKTPKPEPVQPAEEEGPTDAEEDARALELIRQTQEMLKKRRIPRERVETVPTHGVTRDIYGVLANIGRPNDEAQTGA